MPHFYFTGDDYRYRFDAEAKKRFITLLREQFNGGIRYDGRVLKWDTVIERKAMELARFLNGRSKLLDFVEPEPVMERVDDLELRKRILSMSQAEADKVGIGKSTLHYLRINASAPRPFRPYRKTRELLVNLARGVD